jgi:uncharacterized protein (DUF1330 family)
MEINMPAYLVLVRQEPIRDEQEMSSYRTRTQNGPPPPTLKPLALYGDIIGLEGETPDGAVVLEFPNVEDARAWYGSVDYQAAVKHRLNAAAHQTFIVAGL